MGAATLAPGTTVVMDTLSVHRNPAVRNAIAAVGYHLCYLPAYSSDFTPIELTFATRKTALRGVAARAFDPLVEAIGEGLVRITSRDIAGSYRHCGYDLPRPEKHNF